MTGKIDPLFADHPDILAIGEQTQRFVEGLRRGQRPTGSNADEWHLFLSQYLDNRATQPSGLTFIAVQIAEAIDAARGR